MTSFQQQLEDLEGILDEFENCGQSEGRAIAECIKDGTSDCTDAERLEHAESMAAEFVDIAKSIHKRIKALTTSNKLRDRLPKELVDQILEHMAVVGIERADHFLDWDADSGVGECCMKLAVTTIEYLKSIGDRDIIDTTGIWRAAAHQCHIYAYG